MASYFGFTPRLLLLSSSRFTRLLIRRFSDPGGRSDPGSVSGRKGLVVGVYSDDDQKGFRLTQAAQKFNSQTGGKLEEMIKEAPHLRKGKAHVFQNMDTEFFSVAVVGLGEEDVGFNPLEGIDECKETIRVAAAVGARKLKRAGMTMIHCESFGNAEAAAEGAGLSIWQYQEQRNKMRQKPDVVLEQYEDSDKDGWLRGLFKAEAQNLARRLSDTPANLMTPSIFAQNTVDALCQCGVSVEVRGRDWLEDNKFIPFLTVAKGSCEPPVFLEIGYCGGLREEKPILIVGKGITYDAGGLNMKKCHRMPEYRGDVTGAAVVVAVMRAVAALSLPINIQALIPLCENMPSGMAMKPGDVVTALNGKTIQIDNTDNEGRLLLADALVYGSKNYKPKMVIDVGSLTSGMRAALGSAATGVFSNNHDLWRQVQRAGAISGDRVWRFPLWKHYAKKVKHIRSADLTNTGKGGGLPCKAAAFLREFVPCGDWVHFDTTGTGMLANASDFPYLPKYRMTGRPTRTIIQLLYQLACPQTSQGSRKKKSKKSKKKSKKSKSKSKKSKK